ncbi:MAG: hypothetical protein ACOYO1_04135 [Bacteroidales bacterium]
MAKPWIDGAEHSILYSTENCVVKHETILIKLKKNEGVYYANYKIKYIIYSDANQTIPLVFLGIGLSTKKEIRINDISTKTIKLNENESFLKKINNSFEVKFSKDNSLAANIEDLIYFEAKLNKGENTIYIEYDGNLEYNRYGFIKNFKLKYSLYPSRFWKSFGNIELTVDLGDNLNLITTNLNNPIIEKNIVKCNIIHINQDDIEITFTNKITSFSKILLFLQPFGIALILLIIMSFVNFSLIRNRRIKFNTKYNIYLPLGITITPIVFYVVYFLSFKLIDYSLGLENSQHGYVFLIIITYPILLLIYGLLFLRIDKIFKKKYK